MQIFVKDLEGKMIVIEVNRDNTGEEVKTLVGKETDDNPDTFNLIYAGQWMEGIKTISDYKIQKECTLHMSPKWGKQKQCNSIELSEEYTK